MSKDPAFLFYHQDFYTGVSDMTNEEVGAYVLCLCVQASKGGISEKHMKNICKTQDVHNTVFAKFKLNSETCLLENQRLKTELEKRKRFTESRANNRTGKTKDKKNDINISKTYEKHMENVDENENEIKNEKTKKKFTPPSEIEVIDFFIENGFKKEVAKNAYAYYAVGDWKDSKGKKVLNWKQKMRGVWFKDENRTTTEKEMPKHTPYRP